MSKSVCPGPNLFVSRTSLLTFLTQVKVLVFQLTRTTIIAEAYPSAPSLKLDETTSNKRPRALGKANLVSERNLALFADIIHPSNMKVHQRANSEMH